MNQAPAKSQTSTTVSDLRKVAAAKGLIKKLFSQGNSALGAASIASSLRTVIQLSGLEVPTSIPVGLDAAQMILAGGVFVDDLAQGEEILQCAVPGTMAISGAVNLLSDLGLIDPQWGDFASLGANAALAISSGGSNVIADVGVVLSAIKVAGDVSTDLGGSQDAANKAAKKALSKSVHGYLDPQVAFAANQMTLFNQGKINFFDYVASIAQNAPVEFKNFFPGIAGFLPSATLTFKETAESQGLLSSKSDTETLQLKKVCVADQSQIASVLLDKLVFEPLRSYDNYKSIKPVISFHALQLVALLLSTNPSGPVSIDFHFDLLGAMWALGVTPYWLGDTWLFRGLERNENPLDHVWKDTLPYKPMTIPWVQFPATDGIVINGKPYLTPAQQNQFNSASELKNFQLYLAELDRKGDIDTLMHIPESRAMLTQYADIRIDPTFTARGEIGNMCLRNKRSRSILTQSWYVPGQYGFDPVYDGKFWAFVKQNYSIDISDYWKCLGILKQMQSSNLYTTGAGAPMLNALADKLVELDNLMRDFDKLRLKVTAKMLNQKARIQVAGAMGIPADKIGVRSNADGSKVFYRTI